MPEIQTVKVNSYQGSEPSKFKTQRQTKKPPVLHRRISGDLLPTKYEPDAKRGAISRLFFKKLMLPLYSVLPPNTESLVFAFGSKSISIKKSLKLFAFHKSVDARQ
jgi:hypothetical protein